MSAHRRRPMKSSHLSPARRFTASMSPTCLPIAPSTARPAKSRNRRACMPAGVTLEYPMSATARGDEVILSSWFTGTVQVIDRKTGATREMMHDFKAPHDAIRLADGSILVNELGSKSLIRAGGEHGKDRNVLISGLEGPVGLAAGSGGTVYLTEAFAGQVSKIEANGEKTILAKDLKMPEGIALAF